MKGHYDIELSTLQYTKLSEPVELLDIDLNKCAEDCLSADSLTNVVCVTVSRTSPVTALIYWFELELINDCHDVVINTSDEQCHWAQAAILFHDELTVQDGHEYVLRTKCDNGYLGVTVSAKCE
jgi:hypothetical protein